MAWTAYDSAKDNKDAGYSADMLALFKDVVGYRLTVKDDWPVDLELTGVETLQNGESSRTFLGTLVFYPDRWELVLPG